MFRLGTASDPALSYKNNTLTVKGTITATSLTIGNQSASDFVKAN